MTIGALHQALLGIQQNQRRFERAADDVLRATTVEQDAMAQTDPAADQTAAFLGLAELELAIADFAEKAREGTITLEELQGGTFSITNGGVFGSLMSTPLLNPPQSAILGMHTIKERPVVVDGEIAIRPMMYLALSYDHRIIDGKDSVQFLVAVRDALEDPARLLLGL